MDNRIIPSELAGWLSRKGSSLGPVLSDLEDRLELGAIDARGCLRDLDEDQAQLVRRLALAALLALRKAMTAEEEPH